jgi:hypothetical protein
MPAMACWGRIHLGIYRENLLTTLPPSSQLCPPRFDVPQAVPLFPVAVTYSVESTLARTSNSSKQLTVTVENLNAQLRTVRGELEGSHAAHTNDTSRARSEAQAAASALADEKTNVATAVKELAAANAAIANAKSENAVALSRIQVLTLYHYAAPRSGCHRFYHLSRRRSHCSESLRILPVYTQVNVSPTSHWQA